MTLATDVGAAVMRDAVRAVLLACVVLIAISSLGLLVSCCPASYGRGLLATGYLCLGLPAWVLLVFVSVVALAMREGADDMVALYWSCLKQAAPAELREHAWDDIPDRLLHVEVALYVAHPPGPAQHDRARHITRSGTRDHLLHVLGCHGQQVDAVRRRLALAVDVRLDGGDVRVDEHHL